MKSYTSIPHTQSCFALPLPPTLTNGTTNISPLLTALLNYQGHFLPSVYVQSVIIFNELQLYVSIKCFTFQLPITLGKTLLWAYLFYIPGVLISS